MERSIPCNWFHAELYSCDPLYKCGEFHGDPQEDRAASVLELPPLSLAQPVKHENSDKFKSYSTKIFETVKIIHIYYTIPRSVY